MRIALVCDYSLDYMGGAQSVFLDEIQLLRAAGEHVIVIAPLPKPQPGASEEHEAGFIRATFRIPGVGLPVIVNTSALRRRLRRILQDHAIDVVHLHSEFGLTAATQTVAHQLGIPVVHTVHTFFWQGPDLGRLDAAAAASVRAIARALRGRRTDAAPRATLALDSALRGVTLTAAREADTVISPSAHQADALREAGADDVEILPNPMSPVTPRGEPLRHVGTPLRIVWVGRLVKEKRILEFVRAVIRASGTLGPGALDITIVGDGPLLAEAQNAVAAAPAGSSALFRFTRRVGRDEVDRIIRGGHIVALTSYGFDNQPVVVVEAFHAARSVVYADPRLKEGLAEAGILFSSPDVEGMAATIRDLVRHPEIVIAQSARTLTAAQQFEPERHVRRLREIYAAASHTVKA